MLCVGIVDAYRHITRWRMHARLRSLGSPDLYYMEYKLNMHMYNDLFFAVRLAAATVFVFVLCFLFLC